MKNEQQQQMLDVWNEWWLSFNNYNYQYEKKDFRALSLIALKLKNIDNSGNVENNFEVFLKSINSKWHLQNASITLFNSHFNSLLSNADKKVNHLNEFSKIWN